MHGTSDLTKQEMVVGATYQHTWPDGGVGKYVVDDVTETDYGITWSNGSQMRVAYACPINTYSVMIREVDVKEAP